MSAGVPGVAASGVVRVAIKGSNCCSILDMSSWISSVEVLGQDGFGNDGKAQTKRPFLKKVSSLNWHPSNRSVGIETKEEFMEKWAH